MESIPASVPASAVCPKHPDQPAVATCARCGTFICQTCSASVNPPLCEACHARRGIPLLHGPFTFGAAFVGSFRLFWPVIGNILAVAAILAVPIGLINHAMVVLKIESLLKVSLDLIIPGTIGLLGVIASLALMNAQAQEQPRTLGWALGEGFRAFARVFGAQFLAGLKIFLYLFLLVVPGIVKGVKLSMVAPVAYLEDPVDAHERSESLVEGRGWEIFALMLVATIIAAIVVMIPTAALGVARVKAPAIAPAVHVVVAFCSQVVSTWSWAVTLAAYYGLRNARPQ